MKNITPLVTKDQAIEAKLIVDQYSTKISKKHIHPLTCICCKETILTPEYQGHSSPLEQQNGVWVGGDVARINFGYGSEHDGQSFFVGLCDKCVVEHKKLLVKYSQVKDKYYKDIV